MIIAVLLTAGLIMGSFVNALVWRLQQQAIPLNKRIKTGLSDDELSIVKGRSMCSRCHHELAPKDLVPLFSWLWLRGKCRYCRRSIEDSPFVELLLPIVFIVSYYNWPRELTGEGIYLFVLWLIFLVGFAALTIYDIKKFLLPDKIVFPLIGLAAMQVIGQIVFFDSSWKELLSIVLSVVIASGLFFALYQLSGGKWIGGGDVKLGIVLGILLASPLMAMFMLFIASLLGTLAAMPQVIQKRSGIKTKIPFGPYLMVATIIVVLWGQHIVDLYYGWLGLA